METKGLSDHAPGAPPFVPLEQVRPKRKEPRA